MTNKSVNEQALKNRRQIQKKLLDFLYNMLRQLAF